MEMFGVAASLFALVGTFMQMKEQLGQMSKTDPAGFAAFKAVDAEKTEYSQLRHPIRWLRNQRLVAELLAASPVEAEAYRRARRLVASWGLLTAASMLALAASLGSVVGAIHG